MSFVRQAGDGTMFFFSKAWKARREWPKPGNGSFWTFDEVFAAEYRDIHERCGSLPGGAPGNQVPTVENGFVGVALSGGGNRSSTFCLGVLQALNATGTLENVHYLSTVSGGGYIGTAMTVGMSTGGSFPFGQTGVDVGETPETRHLRDNSRYLLQDGVRSLISAFVIYLRGIAMNAVVVVPLLLMAAGVLVLLKPDTASLMNAPGWMNGWFVGLRDGAMPVSVLGLIAVLGLLIVYAIAVSIVPIISLRKRRRIAFVAAVVMAFFGALVLVELHLWILRLAFESHGAVAPASGQETQVHVQVAEALVDRAGKALAWLVPLVVAVLPFLKPIAAKAVSGAAGGSSDFLKRWGSRLILFLAAAIVPLLLWLTMLQLAYWGIGVTSCTTPSSGANCVAHDSWSHAPSLLAQLGALGSAVPFAIPDYRMGLGYLIVAMLFLLAWPILNVNSNSLHQLYRDRLGSAFLARRKKPDNMVSGQEEDNSVFVEDDRFALSAIDTKCVPYHLLNAALNVPGSKYANRRGRNAEFFIFSKNFVGCEATGYVNTEMAEQGNDGLNIGTAMAISGAAAAPNMGMASMRPLSPTIALLNVRLGRWLRHPIDTIRDAHRSPLYRWWKGRPGPMFLIREAFSKSGHDIVEPNTEAPLSTGFVFLTDGGHIENLGVYELLRRRCAVVVAVDGEADPEMTGGSLVQLERFARIDLGTRIVMDWKSIGQRTREVSREVDKREVSAQHGPHVALGLIDYPPGRAGVREHGLLVYIKSSLSGDENDYVMSYKATHPSFPHETTMDQLFTEEQFEAYRALGEHIAGRFLTGKDRASTVPDISQEILAARLGLLDP
jgi:hypothetical protein